MKKQRLIVILMFILFFNCSPKTNLKFYVPNISKESLINDLENSGLEINKKYRDEFIIENLNNQVENIEISIGDFNSENKIVEIELVSIKYKKENEEKNYVELSEDDKEYFKELFSNKVLPFIIRT